MLLWVAVFFCLVVPLHHRGLVSLPGAVSDDEASKPYCPLCTLWDDSDGSAPPADAPISCAICHLKSNLELPPGWTPPPTLVADLDFLLPNPEAQRFRVLPTPRGLRGRAQIASRKAGERSPAAAAPTPYDVVLPIHRPPSVSQRLVSLSPA